MTKWFNTNYQYLVPVIYPDTTFKLNADKPASEYQEAKYQECMIFILLQFPLWKESFLSYIKLERQFQRSGSG